MDEVFQLEKPHSVYRRPATGDRSAGTGHQRRGRSPSAGVTGSGKTFTMANIIARQPPYADSGLKQNAGKPGIVIEMRGFPGGCRGVFCLPYYDYYQPEAYSPPRIPILARQRHQRRNRRLRHSATAALSDWRNVSLWHRCHCIYSLGPYRLPQHGHQRPGMQIRNAN